MLVREWWTVETQTGSIYEDCDYASLQTLEGALKVKDFWEAMGAKVKVKHVEIIRSFDEWGAHDDDYQDEVIYETR